MEPYPNSVEDILLLVNHRNPSHTLSKEELIDTVTEFFSRWSYVLQGYNSGRDLFIDLHLLSMNRSGKTHKRNRAEESLDTSFTLSPYRNRLSCGPDYSGPLTLRISDLSTTVALSDPKAQTNNTKTFLSSSLNLASQQPALSNLKNSLRQME